MSFVSSFLQQDWSRNGEDIDSACEIDRYKSCLPFLKYTICTKKKEKKKPNVSFAVFCGEYGFSGCNDERQDITYRHEVKCDMIIDVIVYISAYILEK